MPSWGQRQGSPALGKAAARDGGASRGGWGLWGEEELQTDRRWGPVLLKCSPRSKTGNLAWDGPSLLPVSRAKAWRQGTPPSPGPPTGHPSLARGSACPGPSAGLQAATA